MLPSDYMVILHHQIDYIQTCGSFGYLRPTRQNKKKTLCEKEKRWFLKHDPSLYKDAKNDAS